MLFNTSRAESYLRQYGLDALVATSPVNITYFTDYACWIDPLMKEYMMIPGASADLGQGYAVFPLEGAPAFVCSAGLMAVNAIDLWIRDIRIFGEAGVDFTLPASRLSDDEQSIYDLLAAPSRYQTATEALAGVLKDRRLTDARIGLEMDGLPATFYEAITRTLPQAEIRDASNLIRLVRMVKSSDELDRLTRAAEISELAATEALAPVEPGMPIADCIQRYRARLGDMGADLDHFAFGYRGLGIATDPTYVLQDDTVEYIDWGCVYRSCFSDTGTTLAMRLLSPEMQRRFDALRGCMDAAIGRIMPGVKASEVQAPMQEVTAAQGLNNMFPHGHGVGLEVRDYPIIVPDNGRHIRDGCVDVPSDLPLEEDMVINLEAPLFMPGTGSLHIEQSFVVTLDGSRPLVPQERSHPFMP